MIGEQSELLPMFPVLRSAQFKTLRPDLFEARQVAKSAFACQAECGNVAAFGLPAQRKKHWGGVKGSLCWASPALDPPQCFLNTPRRNTPCFPSNSDGHYTMQGLAGVAGCLRQPIDNGPAGRPELPRPLLRASASLRQFDDLLAKLRRVRWSAFRDLGVLVA